MSSLVLFGLILAVIIAMMVIEHVRETRRRTDWMAVAPAFGLDYLGESQIPDSCSSFKTFSTGRARKLYNVLSGESGRIRVRMGDYQYTTGSGKNSTTHRFTVCILRSDSLDLPSCYMRPQNPFDALGKLFGGQDIDFADDPVFSKAFVLQGSHEPAIRARFDRQSRAWLAEHARSLQRFEAGGSTIAFLAPRMPPQEASRLLDDALNFLMLWSEPGESRRYGA